MKQINLFQTLLLLFCGSVGLLSQSIHPNWSKNLEFTQSDTSSYASWRIEKYTGGSIVISWIGSNLENFLALYDTSGINIWTQKLEATAVGSQEINDIYVHSSGLIYVTGYVTNETTGRDLFFSCYSPTGSLVFNHVLDGGVNGTDYGREIIEGPSGNFFVNGQFQYSSSFAKGVVVAFSPNGSPLWTYSITGSAGGNSAIYDIDFLGNVLYAAGVVKNLVTGNDAVIVALDQSGLVNWRTEFDDGFNGSESYQVLTHDNTSIYVAGGVGNSGSGSLLQKYDLSGQSVWISQNVQTRVKDLTFSPNGQIVLLRETNVTNTQDILVQSFSTSGVQVWGYIYNPSQNNWDDEANSLTTDALGNVYVAGSRSVSSSNSDQLLLALSSAGVFLWDEFISGTFPINWMAYDYAAELLIHNNHIYTTGMIINMGVPSMRRWATLSKYTINGQLEFTEKIYGEFDETTFGLSVTDNAGNTIAVSYRQPNPVLSIEKVSSSAALIWKDTLVLPNTFSVSNIHLLSNGEIVLTGILYISNGVSKIWIKKLNPVGNVIWSDTYTYLPNQLNHVSAITSDSVGNIYLGCTFKNTQYSNAAVVKFSASGQWQWTNFYSGNAPFHSGLMSDLKYHNGFLYVYFLDYFNQTISALPVITKTDLNGSILWRNELFSALSSGYSPLKMTILQDSSIVTSGRISDSQQSSIYLSKVDQQGSNSWTTLIDSLPGIPVLVARDVLAVGNDIYLTGSSGINSSGTLQVFTARVDSTGNINWWKQFNGNVAGSNYGERIFYVPATNSIAVVGNVRHSAAAIIYNLCVLNYSTSGVLIDSLIKLSINEVDNVFSADFCAFNSALYVLHDVENSLVRLRSYCIGGGFSQSIQNLQVCSGDTVTLTAPAGYSYSWSPSVNLSSSTSSTPLLTASASQSYTCVISHPSGCQIANVYNVSVLPSVNPQLSIPDTLLCPGDSVLISASGFINFSWSPLTNLSGPASLVTYAYPVSTTVYTITGQDMMGCSAITVSDTLNIYSNPVIINLNLSDTVCTTSSPIALTGALPAGGFYSGSGVNGNTFNPSLSDTGWVTIYYYYFDSLISFCNYPGFDSVYVSTCVSVPESNSSNNISLFPNPANETINLTFSIPFSGQLILSDFTGRVVHGQQVTNRVSYVSISSSGLSQGIYTLSFLEEDGELVRKAQTVLIIH